MALFPQSFLDDLKAQTDIVSIIENPRPFVSCPTYFGPDRRRKSIPINFPDRRKTSPS